MPYTDCFARNQGSSITEQLDNGIRSIDIDTCSQQRYDFWEDTYSTKLYSCNKVLFTVSVARILSEIDAWMKNNRNEVIVVSFTGKGSPASRQIIAKEIKKLVLKLWAPTIKRRVAKQLTMSDAHFSTGRWKMLWEAITLNQRIVLFVNPTLSSLMGNPSWAHDFKSIKLTETPITYQNSSNCKNLVKLVAAKCKTFSPFVSVDMYLTRGLPVCTDKRADECNPLLESAADLCFQQRISGRLTVNFLKIDFADRQNGAGFKILQRVSNKLNQRNAAQFLKWQSYSTG